MQVSGWTTRCPPWCRLKMSWSSYLGQYRVVAVPGPSVCSVRLLLMLVFFLPSFVAQLGAWKSCSNDALESRCLRLPSIKVLHVYGWSPFLRETSCLWITTVAAARMKTRSLSGHHGWNVDKARLLTCQSPADAALFFVAKAFLDVSTALRRVAVVALSDAPFNHQSDAVFLCLAAKLGNNLMSSGLCCNSPPL